MSGLPIAYRSARSLRSLEAGAQPAESMPTSMVLLAAYRPQTGQGVWTSSERRGELSVPPRMLKDVSDAMTPIDWNCSVSAPAGPVIITVTLQASTVEKAAELALEAAVQIVPGLVEATVTVQPEGVSAGVRLNLVIARFSVEMGPDGLELQLEFALHRRGAQIHAEAEMSECQPERDKSAQSSARPKSWNGRLAADSSSGLDRAPPRPRSTCVDIKAHQMSTAAQCGPGCGG